MNSIRKKLSKITDTLDLSTQKNLLENLIKEKKITIQIIESKYPIQLYSCAVYVLGFENDDYYEHIAAGEKEAYAGPEFIGFMINKGYLQEHKKSNSTSKNIIVYKHDDKIKHVGLTVSKTRARSKWGLGYLYEHDIFEVPEEYGNDIELYSPLDKEKALDYFIEFARSKGIKFEE